jgi:signal transduction histidine kinase/putative methionine-R-sulfoxide reductase with GAF domain
VNTPISRPDYLQDTRNIYSLAACLSAAFAALGLIGQFLHVVAYSLIPAVLCGVAGILLSGTGILLAPRVRRSTALHGLISIGYVLTATLAIHLAGGPQSFLPALYVGIALAAAFLMGRRGALIIAMLSVACFSVLVALEFGGALPVYPIWSPALDLRERGVVLGGLVISVAVPTFVVAYAAGTLADRLARRTAEQATLALMARDIAASLDADRVIQTVLRRAIDSTSSERGGIYLYDAQRNSVRVAAVEGFDLSPWSAGGAPSWPATIGVAGRVMRTGQTARLADVSRDPDYVAAAPQSRSELCVPIIQTGRVEGVINLESNRPAAYTEAHQRFTEQLAQHAAIALTNARLYAETENTLFDVARANLEIRALQESLSALQSALEPDEALQSICDAVVTLGYDMAVLAITDRSRRNLEIRALAAADAGLIHTIESFLGFTLVGVRTKLRHRRNIGSQALAARRVLVSRDASDFLYPLFSSRERSQALADCSGLRVGAAIPLIARDVPLGILYTFNRKPSLSSVDLSSLQAFGAQAAVALDKANLFEEARTVRDRLQAVLNATHDGLILYDAHTRMALTNRAAERLLGVWLTPYLGETMATVLDSSGLVERLYPQLNPQERQAVIDTEVNVMSAGLRDGTAEVARRMITVPGPDTRFVDEFNLRVEDEAGKLIGRLIVLHDVTDQKQLESDRDAFTQMLVHDLRSPLSAIIGSLQLIELGIQEKDPPELLWKSARIALASAQKLLDLISSLLNVQKLETGQIELELHSLAPASLIQDTLDALRPLAEMTGIALEMSASHDLPPVLGDPEHVRRVLTNLVDNALKFVSSGGLIRASAAQDGDAIRFSIADNGPGIPEQYRVRVFERYWQVPERIGRKRGTGLGLTYCKMVVEIHGGRIWVEETPGGGSTFNFTLPIATRPADTAGGLSP